MKLVNAHKLFILVLSLGISVARGQVWTLEQCIDTAQANNKALKIGRNSVMIADQKHMEATAGLIPKINAAADYRYFTDLPYQLMPLSVFGGPPGLYKEAQFGVPHNINVNLQVSMPLYNPQVYGAIKTTAVAEELTALQYQKTEEQVFFEISNLYYNALILQSQLSFLDSNLANATTLLKNMQLLKEQLLAKGTDVSKIQLQVEQLNTQKSLINSKYQQVMNALKFSMGISIEKTVQVEQNIIYQQAAEYTSIATIDMKLVKSQGRILATELSTLKRSRLPSLSLYGTYGTSGFGYDKEPNNFLKFYPTSFAGIQLSYPLFNGTATQRKISQKKLELQNSELQVALAGEQNIMQVENAKMQRMTTQETVETTLQQVSLARSIYDQLILQHKQGTASLTDVLLADNALREAQQAYLSAVIDYLKADLDLKKLTGNFLTSNTK